MSLKCNSRDAVIKRFGPIDFSSAVWPMKDVWMKMYEVPVGRFPNWKVGGTEMLVRHIYLNRDILEPLDAALKNIINQGLAGELKTFDGCFNIRMVRGRNDLFSAHSYGLAMDFNAALNPLGGESTWTPAFVKCFTDSGFDWGGNFSGRKDPMHVSFCFEHKD